MAKMREDTELIRSYVHTRDPRIREQIILGFLPLVHFVLGRLKFSQSMGADYEDAMSQGLIGLIEALDNYDPSYGTQFTTYAIVRVRGRVLDHLSSLDWLSRSARRRARAVQRAITQLWIVLQRDPTEDELCQYLDLDRNTLQKALLDSNHSLISLDSALTASGENGDSFHEILADDGQNNPAEKLDEQDLLTWLVSALAKLPERQQLLLSLYYYNELTFKEISEMMGVSESRVSQLHARAVVALRSALALPQVSAPLPVPPALPASPAQNLRLVRHPRLPEAVPASGFNRRNHK
jgi:RNA polymerase sigma factor for flagellar operon FliA